MKAFRSICISTASAALYISGYGFGIPGLRNLAELVLWITITLTLVIVFFLVFVVPTMDYQQLSIMVAELKPRGHRLASRVSAAGTAVSAITMAYVGDIGAAMGLIICWLTVASASMTILKVHEERSTDYVNK